MMEHDKLTGIERELVLQYLIDGNVPVTLTPVEEPISSNAEDTEGERPWPPVRTECLCRGRDRDQFFSGKLRQGVHADVYLAGVRCDHFLRRRRTDV